jgi:hypothetical protein
LHADINAITVKKFIHKISEILVVFVLLWIMAGSLIEFHQRYVFHKNADLWKIQATQVKNDNEKKFLKISLQEFQKFDLTDFLTNQQHCGNGLVTFKLSVKSIFSRYLFDLLTHEYVHERTLRGPPLS